jgi:uncharacterized protein YndB with AHSA1/START domain
MMTSLPHVLERSILICAQRATVFRYFTDSARFADWWGQGSVIDGRKGGAFVIRYPNGVTASGEVVDLVPDERVVMSYGYDDPGKPIPPGGSLVTITLHERPGGTLLHLRHEVAEAKVRDEHVQGWRYQLAVFANVAARDQHRGFPSSWIATSRSGASPRPAGGARSSTPSPPTTSRSRMPSAARAGETTSWPIWPPPRCTCPGCGCGGGRRPSLPGHGGGGLDRGRARRKGPRPRHQRLRAAPGRPDRAGGGTVEELTGAGQRASAAASPSA